MSLEDIVNVTKAAKEAGLPVDKLAYNVLEKPTTELGEGIGNIFWLVFSPFKIARATLEPKIQSFKNDILKEIEKIPEERLIEPPLNIVGPTLEAAKYYIEEDELRLLFAKLIASSMDSEKKDLVHPSFVEIIKNLSPFDANCLLEMIHNREEWPVAQIVANTYETKKVSRYMSDNEEDKLVKSYVVIVTHVMPFNEVSVDNAYLYSATINNLTRLSLIQTNYTKSYTNKSRYDLLNSGILDQFFDLYKDEFEKDVDVRFEFQHGIWSFTEFGKLFIRACISDMITFP